MKQFFRILCCIPLMVGGLITCLLGGVFVLVTHKSLKKAVEEISWAFENIKELIF